MPFVSDTPQEHDDAEVVDGLPVPAAPAVLEASLPAPVPARQAAALAATGFVAGAATVAVVSRRRQRAPRRKRRKAKNGLGEIVASNSFLVDVHLLRRDCRPEPRGVERVEVEPPWPFRLGGGTGRRPGAAARRVTAAAAAPRR